MTVEINLPDMTQAVGLLTNVWVLSIGGPVLWYFLAGVVIRSRKIRDPIDACLWWMFSPLVAAFFALVMPVWVFLWAVSAGLVPAPWAVSWK